jgi:hypothetical protein
VVYRLWGQREGSLSEAQGNLELELTRLEVNVAFAYWLWCQKRMKELVNSSDSYSSDAWLVLFTELRRKAQKAEFSWVSALYCFRQLKEKEAEAAGQSEG